MSQNLEPLSIADIAKTFLEEAQKLDRSVETIKSRSQSIKANTDMLKHIDSAKKMMASPTSYPTLRLTLTVSGTEKYVQLAASDPLFGPLLDELMERTTARLRVLTEDLPPVPS